MSNDDSADTLDEMLGRVMDEIREKIAAGDKPDIEAYARQYPSIAKFIRQALSVLEATELTNGKSSLGPGVQPKQLGDFRIIRPIGRGGMGVVYEAKQLSMNRRVALKVLPFAGLVDDNRIQRFQNEVRAVASLDHPNIVSVYTVSKEQGVHYYAMQLIEGQSLAEVIGNLRGIHLKGLTLDRDSLHAACESDSGGTMESELEQTQDYASSSSPVHDSRVESLASPDSTIPRSNRFEYYGSIANLGVQAAKALQHAHDNGVIHRDIKPGNLMIDESLQLFVTDFGLARVESAVGVTMTGDLIGTLRYMAPEQALAKRVVIDHRADIYSLGATLYELATLRSVFQSDDRQQLLKQIAFESPDRPSGIEKTLPKDLETIILKALQKDPDDRYLYAQDLADDLQRFIDHKPILAKPVSLADRAGKWVRRHQPLAFTLVAFLVLATCLSILGYLNALKASELRRRQSYLGDVASAYKSWFDGHTTPAKDILDAWDPGQDEDLISFPYRHLAHLRERHDSASRFEFDAAPNCVSFSPNGNDVGVHLLNGQVFIADSKTETSDQVADFGADSYPPNTKTSSTLAFSSDGSQLFVGGNFGEDRHICRIDLKSGSKTFYQSSTAKPCAAIALSPDGKWILAGQAFGDSPGIWAWRTDEPRTHAYKLNTGAGKRVSCLRFSEGGSKVTCTTGGDTVVSWNWNSVIHPDTETIVKPSKFANLFGSPAIKPTQTAKLRQFGTSSVDFSDKHGWLAFSGSHFTIWESEQMKMRFTLHASPGMQLKFSPSGDYLATSHRSGFVNVWDANKGGKVAEFIHERFVRTVSFSPDGTRLASGSDDKTVRIWRMDHDKAFYIANEFPNVLTTRGGMVVVMRKDVVPHQLLMCDVKKNQVRAIDAPGLEDSLRSIAMSPDQETIATVYGWSGGDVLTWDVTVGAQRPQVIKGNWHACEFLPDGSLVTVGPSGLAIWNWREERAILHKKEIQPGNIRISADGSLMAVILGRSVQMWRMEGANSVSIAELNHDSYVTTVAISPDKGSLSTVDDSGINIWSIGDRGQEPHLERFIQGTEIRSIDISPDQKTLVAGSNTGIRFHDTRTGREIGHIPRRSIDGVRFTDNDTLYYISLFGTGILRTPQTAN